MFSHLHVASYYSLRHGVCSPRDLVQRAVDLELPALALTDRDGLYGAVRFMQACMEQGMPGVLGADLAQRPDQLAVHAGAERADDDGDDRRGEE